MTKKAADIPRVIAELEAEIKRLQRRIVALKSSLLKGTKTKYDYWPGAHNE